MNRKSTVILPLICVCFSSCTKIQCPDDSCVSSAIEYRIDKEVHWNQGSYQDLRICEHIQTLQSQELNANSAIQIALLNNPKIQEIFENIGIAQADLIEAGLFSNPAFDLIFRYPNKKNLKTNIEYTITSSFIDLFLIPLRVKVAKAELDRAILMATNEVLDLAFEVEQSFYELQAAQQDFMYIQPISELTNIRSELASNQQKIGNINSLEFQQIQSRSLEAELEVNRIQNDIIRLGEKLNRLLGFKGDIQWKITESLPEIDHQALPLDALESVAFSERLDLEAARFEVLRISRMLGIKQWWVYTQGRLGIGGERDADGTNLIGPAFTGEIPIFNYGQADRLRIHAELRKAKSHLDSLEIQVLSDVRESYKLLTNNLKIINDYQDRIIPLQSEILGSSVELYNVMGIGIDRLLEIKLQQFQAQSNYNMALRNYWIARVELDHALGGKLNLVLSQIDIQCNNSESMEILNDSNVPKQDINIDDSMMKMSMENHQQVTRNDQKIQNQSEKKEFTDHSVITPNVGSLPWTMDGDVKVFHLIAEPIRREFAPGFWVNCWGYNGSSPGPTIEAVEGDRVRILVTNKLNEPTSIHWHGIILPNGMDGVTGLNQKGIPPGDTFKYEFTLKQNGTFMYHPHADEMTQIALGMEGFFIIHPKDGYNPPIDRDFAIFLHEWNIPMGAKTPSPTEMLDFNLFTFNSTLYPKNESLVVKTGDRVRIRFGNVMMLSHPIHLHGHEFTVTRKGGKRLPTAAQYSEVTVLVSPGETRDIELIADNPGDWALHCHKSHHTMNQMQHDLPNLTGIDKQDIEDRIRQIFPDFMGLMNINGMSDMFEMYGTSEMMDMGMKMKYPPNLSPLGSPGPFGAIDMGGMFSIFKVRDEITSYADPGWYQYPPGTVAESIHATNNMDNTKMNHSHTKMNEKQHDMNSMSPNMTMDSMKNNSHAESSIESWFTQEESKNEIQNLQGNWMQSKPEDSMGNMQGLSHEKIPNQHESNQMQLQKGQ